MNNNRRKQLDKARALIEEALEIVSAARDEEQEYFDAMPESLQGGDKGSAAQEAVDALDEAVSNLETARDSIDDAIA
jgi:NTP pyrophosphatase (non-canonical NTP hydrolase)